MKTNDEIAEHALFVSNLDTAFIDRNRQTMLMMLAKAIADARAAGFAEAIDKACGLIAAVAEGQADNADATPRDDVRIIGYDHCARVLEMVRDGIQALKGAATTGKSK